MTRTYAHAYKHKRAERNIHILKQTYKRNGRNIQARSIDQSLRELQFSILRFQSPTQRFVGFERFTSLSQFSEQRGWSEEEVEGEIHEKIDHGYHEIETILHHTVSAPTS